MKKALKILCLLPVIFLCFFLTIVVLLKWLPVPTTAFMLHHNWKALWSEEIEFARYQWVPYEEIPWTLKMAVIASEDQKFPDHWGIDVAATQAAIRAYREGRPAGGGSTITQQVAKNLFLWGDRSQVRKVLEWGIAIILEQFWGKERILEVYLNIAQFGKQEFGVWAATEYLLVKPLAQVSVQDAALMAAVLPSPARYDIKRPSAYMRSRQAFIQRQINNLGGLAYLRRFETE
ncbi:monofunctional biosynthetic peptidoglycan transglycosylase [Nitrincola tibetensis]|uniref:Biosynthetic peptidoglycan transglycosylase n=1 Tax=Nitrincola tibetensis TaxID=2219697 RepID=A0A364NL25_9GAMM|nr:monofunctional biosynthetic peptidoglycan transglycosylase [Nitrincola tibetensis]RAU17700.1 monofunctional biosynthetic peptidoglycan transglycosylase [Nitrincola tibetensis]